MKFAVSALQTSSSSMLCRECPACLDCSLSAQLGVFRSFRELETRRFSSDAAKVAVTSDRICSLGVLGFLDLNERMIQVD